MSVMTSFPPARKVGGGSPICVDGAKAASRLQILHSCGCGCNRPDVLNAPSCGRSAPSRLTLASPLAGSLCGCDRELRPEVRSTQGD